MKEQVLRLVATGVLSIGLLTATNSWSTFSSVTAEWPNPESNHLLGDGSVWNGGNNGWTLARYYYFGVDDILTYESYGFYTTGGFYQAEGPTEEQDDYILAEWYWNGAYYGYGRSCLRDGGNLVADASVD